MSVPGDADWTQPYYQYCNRLATLHFLTQNGVGARLLFIYLCGDRNPNGSCPRNEAEWKPELSKMYTHIKVTGASQLEKRVHSIFVPVIASVDD